VQKWGDKVRNSKEHEKELVERLNLALTPEQTKRLNDYCLAVANKQGRMPHAIKTKVGRMAIDEWLKKHSKDFDIKF
jgi:hypothetical protein